MIVLVTRMLDRLSEYDEHHRGKMEDITTWYELVKRLKICRNAEQGLKAGFSYSNYGEVKDLGSG